MYDWLADALEGESCPVVTANLRLARTLRQAFGEQQVANASLVWKTPQIHVWGHWLHSLFDAADNAAGTAADNSARLPARLGTQQCRVLWERCIQQEVNESVVSVSSLGRVARDGWVRMNEWNLPPDACANAAHGQDQRIFARTMQRYRKELHSNDWVDDASLPALLCQLLAEGRVNSPRRLTLCGFDRVTPQVQAVLDALAAAGTVIDIRRPGPVGENLFFRCDNRDAELRTAGAWAAQELSGDPALRIAVVVIGLDNNAARSGQLLREGLTPGWQYGGRKRAAAVNVSYGRKLSDYPAVHAALLTLRWLVRELTGTDISLLLRSPFMGIGPVFGRSRLELLLRNWPDRRWTSGRLLRALRGRDESGDATDWIARVAGFTEFCDELPASARPSQWAGIVDETLAAMNWPGEGTLDSVDFQLINRWRKLLNEFAQLELVVPEMTAPAAVSRLAAMAGETLFQPELEGSVLSVLGPLEAAGMEFDRLWIAGLGADDWPPQGRPSPLLSRDLQLQHGMPDSTPQDTADYARRVLNRLRASAGTCCLSYAATVADREQLPTALLADLAESDAPNDPGWHAAQLLDRVSVQQVSDPAPPLLEDEIIGGGAATINQQMSEPFSAFAYGRLGIRWLQAFTAGIAPNIRGSLVHEALFKLYEQQPTQIDIRAWDAEELKERISAAVEHAFQRHERHADSVLRQLFRLERRRTESLLDGVVAVDRERVPFSVSTVERSIEGLIGPLRISLRGDRIDELENADIVILDYKTGATKKFLTSGEPKDMQLVVYACITDRQVAGLGLFNVDSKLIGIDGAGPAIADIDDWQDALDRWKEQVHIAASEIAAGDVRINSVQAGRDARPLNLLSRFPEIKREL